MRHFWLLFLGLAISAFAQETPKGKLILIRHGEATNNIENVYNSDPSNPHYKSSNLTEKGKQEMKTLAQSIASQGYNKDNIAAVFVSPLPRARQSAEILAQEGLFSKDKIVEDKRLTEWQAGNLEGKTVLTVMTPSMAQQFHGELQEPLNNRVLDFYRYVVKKYPDGNVIAITHAIPAQALITLLTKQQVKLSTGEARVLPLQTVK